jgi:hypothetical protein
MASRLLPFHRAAVLRQGAKTSGPHCAGCGSMSASQAVPSQKEQRWCTEASIDAGAANFAAQG